MPFIISLKLCFDIFPILVYVGCIRPELNRTGFLSDMFDELQIAAGCMELFDGILETDESFAEADSLRIGYVECGIAIPTRQKLVVLQPMSSGPKREA